MRWFGWLFFLSGLSSISLFSQSPKPNRALPDTYDRTWAFPGKSGLTLGFTAGWAGGDRGGFAILDSTRPGSAPILEFLPEIQTSSGRVGYTRSKRPLLPGWTRFPLTDSFSTPFYKKSKVRVEYVSLRLHPIDKWYLDIRLFSHALAYRWVYLGKKPLEVQREDMGLEIPSDARMVFSYGNGRWKEDPFFQSFENPIQECRADSLDRSRLVLTPALIQTAGRQVMIAEAGLHQYPGLHLQADSAWQPGAPIRLNSRHARGVLRSVREGDYAFRPVERAQWIARLNGQNALPWRIIGLFESEAQILESDLVMALSEPPSAPDVSWIEPGKAIWDWWNDWSLSRTGFLPGSNTATYKHYIDFAAEKGLRYFNIDDGWSDRDDLLKIKPEVDLEEVLRYAKEKKVEIILWATWFSLAKDPEKLLKHYAEKGVAGFKIDFLDRDDQDIITWMEAILKLGMEHRLLINFHGAPKPTGWSRTYPNEVNREGVFGAENYKWTNKGTLRHECWLPFIRGFAGPIDYTPGGLRHLSEKAFKPVYTMPFVKGTRCHQLALYGVYDAPLPMVSDLPEVYRREPEATDFIARVPTVWAETRVVHAEGGSCIALARKSLAGTWYLFVLNGEKARTLNLDLSFTGASRIRGLADGPGCARNPADWVSVEAALPYPIQVAEGGGFVGQLEK